MLAMSLVAVAALIAVVLGMAHLYLTFFTTAFAPRDAALEAGLKEVSPRLTAETTLWRSQIGFHASHSLGVILFGITFGYLALVQPALFFQSVFLVSLGASVLLGYLVLAKCYWFSRPLHALAIATSLYFAGVVIAHV